MIRFLSNNVYRSQTADLCGFVHSPGKENWKLRIKDVGGWFLLVVFTLTSLLPITLLPQTAHAAALLRPANHLGIVGYWNFNDDIKDYSGNGNHASFPGGGGGGGYASATVSNPSSNLTDFTLLVDLSEMPASWWSAVDTSDGTKGRVYKGDGTTELASDWIRFDDSGETGWLRVKWSGTLASSGTQELQIYPPTASNASYAAGDTYGRYNAYDSDVRGYWTLDEDPTGSSPQMSDRTQYGNHGTIIGSPDQVDAWVYKGLEFDNTATQGVEMDETASLDLPDTITVEAWAEIHSHNSSGRKIVLKNNGSSSGGSDVMIHAYPGNTAFRIGQGSSLRNAEGPAMSLNTPYHLVGTYDRSVLRLYMDGQEEGSLAVADFGIDMNGTDWVIGNVGGSHNDSSRNFDGIIDEVMIHAIARSDAWIAHSYSQSNDNSSFWGSWSWNSEGGGGGGSAPTSVTGRFGQAYQYNGTDSYIEVEDIGTINTISFWIKTDDTTSQEIINIDGTDHIELNGSSQITATSFPNATVYVDGSSSSSAITPGEWHHVTITDSTGVDASTFEIGRVSSSYFEGIIDEVRVFNRVLTATEATSLSRVGRARINSTQEVPEVSGLLGWWTMDGPDFNPATNVFTDRSGNENHGLRSGVVNQAIGKIGQAVEFPASEGDGMINIGSDASLDEPFDGGGTITAWIYPTGWGENLGAGNAASILGKGTDSSGIFFALAEATESVSFAAIFSGSIAQWSANMGAIELDNWYHVAVVYDDDSSANDPTFYINGEEMTTLELSAPSGSYQSDASSNAEIGAWHLGFYNFDGKIDDVRLYDSSLSTTDIERIYNATRPSIITTQ